ncbi:MAG: site-specific DNA-methyltransferase [Thiobacillaceae bacterium]|jgi:DNA modification methylase|nr:site-specific DNA-methyltransferase [Thiobacillaceae bacterium]
MKLHDQLHTLAIEGLIPYARNSRTHSDEQVAQIAASIREFGFTNPVLVDEAGGIIAGHGRVLAARKLGLERVPCLRLEGLTEAQKRAYVITDNKLALNAGWDEQMLAIEIKELQGLEFDLGLLGFDASELDELLALGDATPEGQTNADAVPEVQAEAVTKPGDVWVLGRHRVMCGDATDAGTVALLMSGTEADMLHTDPPYGVDYEGVPNDHLKDVNLEAFLLAALSCAFNVLKSGSNAYVWHADITAYEFIGAFRAAGFKQARPPTIQWVKPSLTMSQGDYHSQNEPCLFGWKEGPARVRVKDRTQTTLWNCERTTEAKTHPTMKPVELCVRAIINSSNPGDTVLDLFNGSGSTLIAAEQTGRRCYAMELSPHYVDVAVRRWQQFTGKTATLESTGEPFPG